MIDRQLETLCTSGCESSPAPGAGTREEGRRRAATLHLHACLLPLAERARGPCRLKKGRSQRSARGGSRSREKAGESCRPFRRAGVSFHSGIGQVPTPARNFPRGDGVDHPVPDDAGDGRRPDKLWDFASRGNGITGSQRGDGMGWDGMAVCPVTWH